MTANIINRVCSYFDVTRGEFYFTISDVISFIYTAAGISEGCDFTIFICKILRSKFRIRLLSIWRLHRNVLVGKLVSVSFG